MRRFCSGLAQSFTKVDIVRTLKRILFQKSHLAPYLPFMKQELDSKIIRLHEDNSYQNSYTQQAHQKSHGKTSSTKRTLESMLIISKTCYDPINNWLMVWYVFVFCAIIITYVEMGVALTYGQVAWIALHTNPISIAFNIFFLLVFIGDTWVQLNTGYLFRGVIIIQKQRAVGQYLRTYFIADLLLVIILISSLISQDVYLNIVKIIVVTKFIRMFQIDELYLRKLSTNKNLKIVYVIGKQFITIFVLAHTIGLFFYAIDFALTKDPVCINDNSLCWLFSATTYSPILNYNWQIQYFYSVYWGINTIATISYGDIAPNNPQQTTYATFCFCFGFVVYGYVVNSIIKVILWARTIQDNFKHQLIVYTTYMDNLKINQSVQYEIRDYLEHQFLQEKERNIFIQEEMKSLLPENLREELLKNAYQKLHNNLQYILLKSPSITKLLYSLQQKNFTENEVILQQGAPLANLYYLHQGQVILTCIYGKKNHPITEISNAGSFLSHYQFFLSERATCNIMITRTSTLYIISKSKIQQQLEKFTDLRENFKLVQYELRFGHNYQKIFYNCFYCKSNHHWYECLDAFPNFSNVKFILPQIPKKRQSRKAHKTWRDKCELKELLKINQDYSFVILQKMKKRVYELKKMKQAIKNQFDVDVCHEWRYFLPDFNLSVFKLLWKDRKRINSSHPHQPHQELKQPFSLNILGL